jgi:hypothetical protein
MIIDDRVHFVHIPRTGGRFLRDSLLLNNYTLTHIDFVKLFKGKEVPHLTYPEYEQYSYNRYPENFCIVRDPLDRFISMVSDTWMLNEKKIDKMFKDQTYFDEIINQISLQNESNWFVPQINFINYKTKIWRFEDKLDEKFIKWLADNFNIKIIIKADKQQSVNSYTNKINLNNKQIGYIKDYYYKDYKILNY